MKKRSVPVKTTPELSRHRRPLKELWQRLLSMDELEEVSGGGEPKPISTGGGG